MIQTAVKQFSNAKNRVTNSISNSIIHAKKAITNTVKSSKKPKTESYTIRILHMARTVQLIGNKISFEIISNKKSDIKDEVKLFRNILSNEQKKEKYVTSFDISVAKNRYSMLNILVTEEKSKQLKNKQDVQTFLDQILVIPKKH